MTRLLTLASTGLFAAGLAIFPVSVFAQPNAATGTDTKPAATAPVAGHDVKTTAPVTAHDTKAAMPAKDAAKGAAVVKPADTKTSAVKPATGSTPAKVGG
jgi:hypothetical protein